MRLFIAEKPSLGRAIADGLGGGERNDGYIECANGDVVTWCFGHLLELVNPEEYSREWASWSKEILPMLPKSWRKEPRKDKGVSKQLKTIGKLLQSCSEAVNAGDPDREGQLIVDEVLEHHNYKGPCTRIWLAALDAKSVAKALSDLEDNAKYKLLRKAAMARSMADWLYGMNTTRALTIVGRAIGVQGVLSGGRVQTATLALIGTRCNAIEQFKPQNYYVLEADLQHRNGPFKVRWTPEEGLLTDKTLAERMVQAVAGQTGKLGKIDIEEKSQSAPLPHCLSSLQAEANRLYGLSAKQTLDIAQKLYEGKLTTYPRSDCRYLPEEQFGEVAAVLGSLHAVVPSVDRTDPTIKNKTWNTAKVTAHHAIIPTGEAPRSLDKDEARIFELICHGYVRQFFTPLRYEARQILIDLPSESDAHQPTRTWKATGRRVLDPGWTIVGQNKEPGEKQDAEQEEQIFPDMNEGDTVECLRAEAKPGKTKPPARFTEGSLITAMANVHNVVEDPEAKKTLRENEGIGTEATRAGIIETLKKRRYIAVKSNKIHITGLGENVLNIAPETLKDPVTTAVWERNLSDIAGGKLYPDKFMLAQEDALPQIVQAIFAADVNSFKVDVPKCPECGSVLQRWPSKKDKKQFYWSCMNKEQHPDGQPVFLPDDKGKPGVRRPTETAPCPTCGKTLSRRQSKKNKKIFYWACESRTCPLLSDDKGKPGRPFKEKN